ncbi:MAG: hypothetical protein IT377_33585 [Polyangiaceae bacterium]|nr:hypothetical protein [Polyangiaceae bacterium]
MEFTRRELSLKSPNAAAETWLLPLNKNLAFDFRGRNGTPLQALANYDSLASSGKYRMAWAGDAASLFVAVEMPTLPSRTGYDFSKYLTGRVSPTVGDVLEMAKGNWKAKRGSFLKFSWRGAVDYNKTTDHYGEIEPQTIRNAVALATCRDFDGKSFWLNPLSAGMWGDSFGPLKPWADTIGYVRMYDIGSCSASTPFRQFADDVAHELTGVIEQHDPKAGKVEITINSAKAVIAPALVDAADPIRADKPGAIPTREFGQDGLDLRMEGSGVAKASAYGGVFCSFSFAWQGTARLSVDPDALHFTDRVKAAVTGGEPSIKIKQCTGAGLLGVFLDLVDQVIGPFFEVNLTSVAQRNASGDRLRGRFVDRLVDAADGINQATMFPVPAIDTSDPAAFQLAFREWRERRLMSPALLHRDPGRAGSCVAPDFSQVQTCTAASIADTLAQIRLLRPRLADAIERTAQLNPKTLECRPVRGGAAYVNQVRKASVNLPRWVGDGCMDQNAAPRLFDVGGNLIQGCVVANDAACKPCFAAQDGGKHCDFALLRAHDCLSEVKPPDVTSPAPQEPQVLCQVAPAAANIPGLRCVPRFSVKEDKYGAGERWAMCVPVSALRPECEDCLAIWTTKASAADVSACRDAPDYCRVHRGAELADSCDATLLADEFEAGIARVVTPLRCGLRLPLSRLNVEPDRFNLVLAEAHTCESPPCKVNNLQVANRNEAETTLWRELLLLAADQKVNLVAPGFAAPSCYPDRTEVGSNSDPVLEGAPMGFIAQLERTQWGPKTTVNSPICGWVKAPPYAGIAP